MPIPKNVPINLTQFSQEKIKLFIQEFTPYFQNSNSEVEKIGGNINYQSQNVLDAIKKNIFINKTLTDQNPIDIQYQKFYLQNISSETLYNIRILIDDLFSQHKYEIQFEEKNINSSFISTPTEIPTSITDQFVVSKNYKSQKYITNLPETSFLNSNEYIQFWLKKTVTKDDLENQILSEPMGLSIFMEGNMNPEEIMDYLIYGSSQQNTSNDIINDIKTTGNLKLIQQKQNSFSVDGNGKYICFAYPKKYGEAMITMNGLINNQFEMNEVTFLNDFNQTDQYYLYKSMNLYNGTNIYISIL